MGILTPLIARLEAEQAACLAAAAALEADGRSDEAKFAQVRRNIFEIMSTTAWLAEGTEGGV